MRNAFVLETERIRLSKFNLRVALQTYKACVEGDTEFYLSQIPNKVVEVKPEKSKSYVVKASITSELKDLIA